MSLAEKWLLGIYAGFFFQYFVYSGITTFQPELIYGSGLISMALFELCMYILHY